MNLTIIPDTIHIVTMIHFLMNKCMRGPVTSSLLIHGIPVAYSRNVVWLYAFTLEQVRLGQVRLVKVLQVTLRGNHNESIFEKFLWLVSEL